MDAPLVSVLLLTIPGREKFLEAARACIRAQTYPVLEVIEDDGPGLIGVKRNRMCERAAGKVIVHFDDDDWSHPDRIASNVALLGRGFEVAGFHSMLFHDGVGCWRYSHKPPYALGTSLCYRKSYWQDHRFPEVNEGEDNDFVFRAARACVLVSVDAGHLMVARIHSGNTSKKATHNGDAYKPVGIEQLPEGYAWV